MRKDRTREKIKKGPCLWRMRIVFFPSRHFLQHTRPCHITRMEGPRFRPRSSQNLRIHRLPPARPRAADVEVRWSHGSRFRISSTFETTSWLAGAVLSK